MFTCPYPFFGRLCTQKCNCSQSDCDFIKGFQRHGKEIFIIIVSLKFPYTLNLKKPKYFRLYNISKPIISWWIVTYTHRHGNVEYIVSLLRPILLIEHILKCFWYLISPFFNQIFYNQLSIWMYKVAIFISNFSSYTFLNERILDEKKFKLFYTIHFSHWYICFHIIRLIECQNKQFNFAITATQKVKKLQHSTTITCNFSVLHI